MNTEDENMKATSKAFSMLAQPVDEKQLTQVDDAITRLGTIQQCGFNPYRLGAAISIFCYSPACQENGQIDLDGHATLSVEPVTKYGPTRLIEASLLVDNSKIASIVYDTTGDKGLRYHKLYITEGAEIPQRLGETMDQWSCNIVRNDEIKKAIEEEAKRQAEQQRIAMINASLDFYR